MVFLKSAQKNKKEGLRILDVTYSIENPAVRAYMVLKNEKEIF